MKGVLPKTHHDGLLFVGVVTWLKCFYQRNNVDGQVIGIQRELRVQEACNSIHDNYEKQHPEDNAQYVFRRACYSGAEVA